MTAVITLTTDFGVRDPYVAEMKAVREQRGRAISRAAGDDGPPQSVDDFADDGAGALVDAEPPAGAADFSAFAGAGFSAEALSLLGTLLLFSDSSAFFRDSEG